MPVVTPAGGLACHVDAMRFIDHVPQSEYPAGALAGAMYIVSGARGMELLRMAVPRRVYTMSHCQCVADRLEWLYRHRTLIGGLAFYEEPPVLRFFAGLMKPTKSNWGLALVEAFERDFGTEC